MGITLDFTTGMIGWSSGTSGAVATGTFQFIDGTYLDFIDGTSADFIT